MIRFTEWDNTHTHGCGLPGKDCFTRLAEYEDLDEQGRLVKLPVSPGSTVYKIINNTEACYKFVAKTHRIAYGMKATFL